MLDPEFMEAFFAVGFMVIVSSLWIGLMAMMAAKVRDAWRSK